MIMAPPAPSFFKRMAVNPIKKLTAGMPVPTYSIHNPAYQWDYWTVIKKLLFYFCVSGLPAYFLFYEGIEPSLGIYSGLAHLTDCPLAPAAPKLLVLTGLCRLASLTFMLLLIYFAVFSKYKEDFLTYSKVEKPSYFCAFSFCGKVALVCCLCWTSVGAALAIPNSSVLNLRDFPEKYPKYNEINISSADYCHPSIYNNAVKFAYVYSLWQNIGYALKYILLPILGVEMTWLIFQLWSAKKKAAKVKIIVSSV